MPKKSKSVDPPVPPAKEIPAGDFSSWLAQTRQALLDSSAADVACGECKACCDSSYFIHIRPRETKTLSRIEPGLLFAAPGMPEGHLLMGYDKHGSCPMLVAGKCSIYQDRPQTCRAFDCRVFTASGVDVDGKKETRIQDRVESWRFTYPSPKDVQEHAAVRATAAFIRENADCFPGKAVPTVPSQLAILAIKTYGVMVSGIPDEKAIRTKAGREALAAAIVQAAKEFDARMEESATGAE
jgi:uncharacterized protein